MIKSLGRNQKNEPWRLGYHRISPIRVAEIAWRAWQPRRDSGETLCFSKSPNWTPEKNVLWLAHTTVVASLAHWTETPGQTQDLLEGLYLTMCRDPRRIRDRGVWISQKEHVWMEEWVIRFPVSSRVDFPALQSRREIRARREWICSCVIVASSAWWSSMTPREMTAVLKCRSSFMGSEIITSTRNGPWPHRQISVRCYYFILCDLHYLPLDHWQKSTITCKCTSQRLIFNLHLFKRTQPHC